jgi:menaquinone-9 beta-reductase
MPDEHFDALVVGAGPAGSVAALVLARAGARVALLDKAEFPRDKACGDLVGPRGVRVMADLGLGPWPGSEELPAPGDMLVVGPTGRHVRLPSADGLTYPGHGLAIPRLGFDAWLRDSAVEAGAQPVTSRAGNPLWDSSRLCGFELDDGRRLVADAVIGADGATSRVAAVAGLLDPKRVLWGFAVRCHVDHPVALPTIVMWEPVPRQALCGYGWIFPGPGGRANLGLGLGTLSDRRLGARAVRLLPDFVEHLARIGLLPEGPTPVRERLGGWLKMGMVGTLPAGNGALLVGDAAGLVNPLQGEGIAHAMTSGRAAAEAVLAGPAQSARRYRNYLAEAHLPYQQLAATAHAALLGRPRMVSATGRLLTLPGLSSRLAEGWAVFWNELLDGAPPGRARSWALAATVLGRAGTSRSATARWFADTLGEPPSPPGRASQGRRRPPARTGGTSPRAPRCTTGRSP